TTWGAGTTQNRASTGKRRRPPVTLGRGLVAEKSSMVEVLVLESVLIKTSTCVLSIISSLKISHAVNHNGRRCSSFVFVLTLTLRRAAFNMIDVEVVSERTRSYNVTVYGRRSRRDGEQISITMIFTASIRLVREGLVFVTCAPRDHRKSKAKGRCSLLVLSSLQKKMLSRRSGEIMNDGTKRIILQTEVDVARSTGRKLAPACSRLWMPYTRNTTLNLKIEASLPTASPTVLCVDPSQHHACSSTVLDNQHATTRNNAKINCYNAAASTRKIFYGADVLVQQHNVNAICNDLVNNNNYVDQ
ncbi:unnamed protein product, partial [Amoebophrya sp. A120]